jgi:AcrR family transcriptional regulator
LADVAVRSGAATRDRILAVALELFASKGYAATSVRDITERLGMTKASLYYHFTSKEEILRALLSPIGVELTALVERGRSEPGVDARAILTSLVDILCRRAGIIRILMANHAEFRQHLAGGLAARDLFLALADILSGGDQGARRIRARCAVGAAQIGVFSALADAAVSCPPVPTAEEAERLLNGQLSLLDPVSQGVVVEAALGALGPA